MEEAWEYTIVSKIDAFGVFWTGTLLAIVSINVAWAINDLKRGSARLSWYGGRVDRKDEPFEFWLAVISKFLALPVGAFMLWFASDILWS